MADTPLSSKPLATPNATAEFPFVNSANEVRLSDVVSLRVLLVGAGNVTYDSSGRVGTSGDWTHTYDSAGRLASSTTGSITRTYTYDSVGRYTGYTEA